MALAPIPFRRPPTCHPRLPPHLRLLRSPRLGLTDHVPTASRRVVSETDGVPGSACGRGAAYHTATTTHGGGSDCAWGAWGGGDGAGVEDGL